MKDKILHWIARRAPKQLLYWCVIHAWAKASEKYDALSPDEIDWHMVCEFLSGGE